MSPQDDPVQPTPFDVAKPVPDATPGAAEGPLEHPRGTPAWVLPALGVLLALTVAVIVWLPASLETGKTGAGKTEPAAQDTAANTGRAVDATPPTKIPASDAAPWSDARAARERREAQEMAAALLDLQYSLEERGVEQWAREPFTAAKALAAEGDTLYRERNYSEARARYEGSLAALRDLEQSIPAQLERLLDEARQAIEDSEATVAEAALSVAGALSPDNPDIAALLARAALLPRLSPLLEQAREAEAAGDLSGAQAVLEHATALDPEHQYAQSELDRVTALVREQDFNEAMSKGYAALDKGRYDSARKAFREAAQLQQGSEEAASALLEVAAAETAGRLTSLDQRGRRLEREEQWQQAVEVYQQASALDASVLFAQEGLARSRPRAELDRQLQQFIAEPQRLSDLAVAAQAGELLARAGQVVPAGPRLQGQLRQLETLLARANTSVSVTLRSDSETEVTVYKVARLGRFDQRELTLRPGTYTAVGTRDGYRDVRRSFTVAHDGAPAPVTVICTEPI